MRTRAILAAVLVISCSISAEKAGPQRRGTLLMDIYPNPILAHRVHGNVYDFPFEVSLREVGGTDVQLDGIRVEVKLKGLAIFAQTFDETELTRRGFSSHVPAGGNLQYRFSPRREVPTEILFSHVSATIAITGTDRAGRRSEASTTVTVTPK